MKNVLSLLSLFGAVQCMVVNREAHVGKSIKFKVCPSPKATAAVTQVEVTPCDVEPCILHRGGSANFEIDFTPTAATTTLKSVVKGRIGPVWVPFPLDHDDACQGSGLTCPLVAGQAYKFNYSLPIKTAYPALKLPVSWEFQGDDGSEVVCVEMPVQLE